MPTVAVPGVGRVAFPDGMSEDDISSAINDHFKQVGVEATFDAVNTPLRILTNPLVGQASAGARQQSQLDRASDSLLSFPQDALVRAREDYLQGQDPDVQGGYESLVNTPRNRRIAAVRALQERMSPSEWTPEPETIEGAMQGVAPFRNPVKGAIHAGISGMAAGQRALGMPAYDPDARVIPPELADKLVEGATQEIFGDTGARNVAAQVLGPRAYRRVAQTGEGVRQAASELLQGFTPSDIAMVVPGGGLGYANEMLQEAPGAARHMMEEAGAGNVRGAAKAGAELTMGVAAPYSIFKHTGAGLMPRDPYVAPFTGRDLVKPRGSRMAFEPPEEVQINSPEAARALENQMQREATGEDFNPARRLPKPVVPEEGTEPARGISAEQEQLILEELQDDQIRKAGARTKEEIRKLFPEMNRQQAAEARKRAWREQPQIPVEGVNAALAADREVANAEGIRSDTGQPGAAGETPERGEGDSSGNVEQTPPGGPKPVAPGGATETPSAPKVEPPPEPPKPELPPLRPDPPIPEDQFPPLPKGNGNKMVTIQRRDGTTYRAGVSETTWPPEITKALGLDDGRSVHRIALNKDGTPDWSTGMLDKGEKIIEDKAPEPVKTVPNEAPPGLKSETSTKAFEQLKTLIEQGETDPAKLDPLIADAAKDYRTSLYRMARGALEGDPNNVAAHYIASRENVSPADELIGNQKRFAAAQPETRTAVPPEVQKLGLVDDLQTSLDQAAEEALRRITARGTGKNMNLGGMFNELPNAKDYVIYAAAKLAKYGARTAEWTADMLKAFGPEVQKHLDAIYDAAIDHINTASMALVKAKAGAVMGAGEPQSTTGFHPGDVPTYEVPIDKIKLSSEVPNFKGGASAETGTVEGQELSGKYERRGTAPIVVWQRTNGDLEVITGRHRLDLARRTGEKTIPAQVVRESQGFTKAQAMTFDAEANIRDGQGDVSDYATYFKGTDISEGEARARGLLSRAKGKAGWVLAKAASNDVYASWRAGKLTDAQAVAIAEAAPGAEGAQRAGIKLALDGKSPEIISGVLRRASQVAGKAENLDLFGADDTAIKQMEADEAKAAEIRKGIKDQIQAVQGAAKKPESAAKLGVNVKDPGAVLRKVNELKGELDRWQNWWAHKDLVDQVRPPEKPAAATKPKAGGDLFGGDTPFNLVGETQPKPTAKPTVAPSVELTGFGNETLAQHELFAIEKVVESKDPTKSADAAQQLYGGPKEAITRLEKQLETIDKDPKVAKSFTKEQRVMLKNVIALLRERGANAEKTITQALNDAANDALKRIDERDRGTKFGSGVDPAHYLANLKDYAVFGAAKLAKFGLDQAGRVKWDAEMLKTFTKKIAKDLDKIYEAAKEHFQNYRDQFAKVTQPTSVQDVINRATGAQAADRIAPESHAIDVLQSGLQTARALVSHFKGQPKISKADVKIADDWLEADANRIRESLIEQVKRELPVSERGRFVAAIANATRRVSILKGDPETMYKRAAQVAARIEDRANEVRKNDAISNLKKTVERALSSPSVDIDYKNRIVEILKRINFTKPMPATIEALKRTRDYINRMADLGEDVSIPKDILDSLETLTKIPLREMDPNAVRALADKIELLERVGRLKVELRQAAWDKEKAAQVSELENEQTTPYEKRAMLEHQPGEADPFSVKLRNWLNKTLNGAGIIDRALLPIDALFDMMGDGKGGYRGWLFRRVRGPLDLAFNDYSVLRDAVQKQVVDLVKKHDMGQREAERIGVYAIDKQEGGHARLVDMGISEDTIEKINRTLTKPELEVYNAMRKAMDEQLPLIQKLMHELYNIDVKAVDNYFPMMRDWEKHKARLDPEAAKEPDFGSEKSLPELATWREMFKEFQPPDTTSVEKGATIERVPEAKTPIKINAFDLFYNHTNDIAYLLKTQRDLKMIGEMARSKEFQGKYGRAGQAMVLDFLDTYARQGRIGGLRRIPWLDELRTRTSAGIVGLRIASQFVHASNVALAIERAGAENYRAAMTQIVSNPEARAFIKKNFAEALSRGGGEPDLVTASENDLSVFGKTIVPKAYLRAGFEVARQIDKYNAEATMLGVYFKELRAKGIDPTNYLERPVDKAAQAHALVLARRAVASPLPKDVPMALTRGYLSGGNISLGRAAFQFQNIFLDQWSNMRHDLWKAGIREKNPKIAARMMLALAGTIAAETAIRGTVKEAINSATGAPERKNEEPVSEKVLLEVMRRFPLGGQIASQIRYNETGLPWFDAILQTEQAAKKAVTSPNADVADRNMVKAAGGVGTLLGIPGSGQAADIATKLMQ